jgi:hypothetical protein
MVAARVSRKARKVMKATDPYPMTPDDRPVARPLTGRLGFKPVEGLEHFAEHRQDAIQAIYGRRTE